MERSSRVFKVALASAIGLFALIGAQEQSKATDYRYLCTSVPSACEYAPATAPGLVTDVCWNGSAAYLMPAGGCTAGQWGYSIKNGEVVDPVTNEVQAYVPLDDACDAGYCTVKPPNAGPTEPGAMCCNAESGCVSTDSGMCGNDTLLWCEDGEVGQQTDGVWDCFDAD